jgi:hypothetical protein
MDLPRQVIYVKKGNTAATEFVAYAVDEENKVTVT